MKRASRMAVAALALGLPLGAADTSFGLSATIMQSTGSLATFTGSSTGLGVGTFVMIDLGQGRMIRPRVDFVSYPGTAGKFKLQQFSAGADYVYFTGGPAWKGTYLVAGAGLASNNYQTYDPLYSRSYTNPYLGLGIGYQFNPTWAVEFRYSTSRFTDQHGTATSVNGAGLATTVRF